MGIQSSENDEHKLLIMIGSIALNLIGGSIFRITFRKKNLETCLVGLFNMDSFEKSQLLKNQLHVQMNVI